MKLIIKFTALFFLMLPLSAAAQLGALPDYTENQRTESPVYIAGINCSAKARSVAASHNGAQILSVEQQGNSCVIVIKVKGQNGYPPRIITRTVSG